MTVLPRLDAGDLAALRVPPVDPEVREAARAIVDDVARRGDEALREHAERLGDLEPGAPLVLGRGALEGAAEHVGAEVRELLERTARRVRAFAEAQRRSLVPLDVPVPGGRAGHDLVPVESVGAYAPGGRFPLPSSVLMTAVTARVAGVERVLVASPRPAPVTLAAALVAGADGVLAVGGAQAIAALAHGTESVPAVDFVCGPGNAWVTAAKELVAGRVGIDGLAGPSELLVIADDVADPAVVAADLLAQAEHDPDARPLLVTPSAELIEAVDAELAAQLESLLPTCATEALERGGAVLVADLDEAVRVADAVAPEHLELLVRRPEALRSRLRHAGALFLGAVSAEVLGDYGAGPNHVLPTGGGSRSRGGLSVLDFLRVRTWLALEESAEAEALASDAAALARLEGLEAHARSADRRGPRRG